MRSSPHSTSSVASAYTSCRSSEPDRTASTSSAARSRGGATSTGADGAGGASVRRCAGLGRHDRDRRRHRGTELRAGEPDDARPAPMAPDERPAARRRSPRPSSRPTATVAASSCAWRPSAPQRVTTATIRTTHSTDAADWTIQNERCCVLWRSPKNTIHAPSTPPSRHRIHSVRSRIRRPPRRRRRACPTRTRRT